MNCLLYCSEILGVLLFIPWSAYAEKTVNSSVTTVEGNSSTVNTMNPGKGEIISMTRTTSVSPTPQITQTTAPPSPQFLKKECLQVTLVCGGLILVSTFLLIITLLLTWKICQLRRCLKMMSSNTEFWVETDKKNQSEPQTETKETTVLMADLSQTNQEMKNGSAMEDVGKADDDGQTEEKKEAEETPNTEEASAAVEASSPSNPQEEAGSSQPTAAVAASSSEVTEEPKDVP
ncbi:uncharacterized protein LOC121653862 [Melanotaenia boesemani]|uniref:uncharacterized protein LOC121653862 n=1 Tax=Melanotaenia boesemani TaxID=1250792 RepID=UPI001C052DE9|nr:uncharacterized protein LOC121653862 [Melanotaenia boesemani]XP_041863525.1 uncharacterized protein LOC121653862 [Melanotaenia boesemani]